METEAVVLQARVSLESRNNFAAISARKVQHSEARWLNRHRRTAWVLHDVNRKIAVCVGSRHHLVVKSDAENFRQVR